MTYNARKPQLDMVRPLLSIPRAQLIASMGLGKTGAAITLASQTEALTGRWPGVLVLAPTQVALAWAREVPRWRPDLTVATMLGSAAQKRAALNVGGDITVANYEALQWLDKHGPADWSHFGSICVADECTALRGCRSTFQTSSLGNVFLKHSKDAPVRASALADHAGQFNRWVNMTATPVPNGMLDVWGQYFFVDGGYRLGRSFTAFKDRWFMMPVRGGDFAKPVPLPGAVEEISRMVSDVTVVCKAEDYYTLDKPRIVNRTIELPTAARKAYADMKRTKAAELQTMLDTHTVTVQAAAQLRQKMLQIGAGWLYWRDDDLDPDLQQCTFLHDAKADAIESILNETGENLVVAYQHKAMLQILQKKFGKRLRTLDAHGKAQDDWNAGKVEILAIQYAAGSLGLSLQHGGRNICLVEPTDNAEHYIQILERLGPMRQMQSGYKRTVNVFRVMADQTLDQTVFDRTERKVTFQTGFTDDLAELVNDLLR